MKQTQVDYAQLAQQLLSADKNNNRLEITALVQTFADEVARIAVARVHYLRDGELVVWKSAYIWNIFYQSRILFDHVFLSVYLPQKTLATKNQKHQLSVTQ